MENAVVYARYSSHSQTEQSIEGQLSAARKYAVDHEYKIVKEYCDRAKTGTNDNREEFQRMLRDCSKKQFSVIIVWKVDRFGRNREEITFNKYKAKKNGVRVEYIAENIVAGPEGVILESVLEGMAEYYSLQLSQNIRRGMLESAKKFKNLGARGPLGYGKDADKNYIILEDQAEVVRTIFNKYANGESLAEISQWLNDRHYTTSHGKPFSRSSLPRMLRNEIYIGTYKYKDVIKVEDAIPAIIDKDLFHRVQNKLEYNKKHLRNSWVYEDYLLTGKIYCGICGSPMIGECGTSKTGAKYHYYVCSKKKNYNNTCDCKRIRQDFIEEKILEIVYNTISDPILIETLTAEILKYQNEVVSKNDELKHLESELKRTNSAINNLLRSIENGLDYDLVRCRMNELQRIQGGLNDRITKETLNRSRPMTLSEDLIKQYLTGFFNGKIKDRASQKQLINTFVNSVLVDDTTINVAFNYCAETESLKSFEINDEVRPYRIKWSSENNTRTFVMSVNSFINVSFIRNL